MVAAGLSAAIRLWTTHVAANDAGSPLGLVFGTAGHALGAGGALWLVYVAVEPYGRRGAPALLVGWVRVLQGRLSDPRVGRDVLLGIAAGLSLGLWFHVAYGLPTLVNLPGLTPAPGFTYVPQAASGLIVRIAPGPAILDTFADALNQGLWGFTMVVVLRAWLRPPATTTISALVFTVIALGTENPIVEVPTAVIVGVTLAWAANQWGLLALVASLAIFQLVVFGATLGVSPLQWCGPYSSAVLIGLVALVVWTFRVSLGGAPAFGSTRMEA